MSGTRLITRSVTKNRPIDMTLNLECSEEPLSEVQVNARTKLKEDVCKVTSMIEEMIKEHGGTLICQSGVACGYQYTLPTSAPTLVNSTSKPMLNVNQSNNQQIKLNMLNNANTGQGNIQLVMDPRGVILGTVASPQGTPTATPPVVVSSPMQQPSDNFNKFPRGRRPNPKTIHVQQPPQQQQQQKQPEIIEEPPTTLSMRTRPKPPSHVVTPQAPSPQSVSSLRVKQMAKPSPPPPPTPTARPAEHSSIGGIAVGSKNAIGEQIEESKKNLPDGREVTFNKMNGGRTFPSLVVVARPNLRSKNVTPQVAQKERSDLDMKVKSVLMFSATKFAEWLIQMGLVRSEQYCSMHTTDFQKMKLKLGMYSDSGTFPYSGGYVWISSCCPDRFVSVFNGSLFQGAPHTPTVLLKLIYHWSCQTNVQNVVSWVKVSNVYVKNFYTNLRSICTAAVCDKSRIMGGKNSMIQVGVISLGTTSQDGNLRQVKVEVLGVLDPETLELRLRACDPVHDGDRSYKRRFNNILHPLKEWVHKDSKILTDFTVDKSTLHELGFTNISQSTFTDQNPRNITSNYHIMEYLRKIVPRMFQNTLSLLSRQMIQQFLDELVWREMFGTTAGRAFDNIILHIAEQTRIDSNMNLLERLSKIAANPFYDWSYSNSPQPAPPLSAVPQENITQRNVESPTQNTRPIMSESTPQKSTGPSRRGRKRTYPVSHEIEPKRANYDLKGKENKGDQVSLQEYYYATMEGEKNVLLKEQKSSVHYKCFLCTAIMRCNTEVMEHIIGHVPPRMPGQAEAPVCRYCCTVFSSKNQRTIHVSETHSNFGNSSIDMVVCAICEEKFATTSLLIHHLSSTHYSSEMPYRCETCGYRSSSHKDVIDHYYKTHAKGEGLQCPFCLKVIQFSSEGSINKSNVHAYLLHMQRHIVRREEGRGNKCSRCCLWFNQKSALKIHQKEMHIYVSNSKVVPYTGGTTVMISKSWHQVKRFEVDIGKSDLPADEIEKWDNGPIKIHLLNNNYPCQECEEDIDGENHYPGEQRCNQCRYVTCCWRAFKEHQRQIHNERPLTSLVVPSPLINIPLDMKMQCSCGFATYNGNQLATHLVKCKKRTALPIEDSGPSGMLDSLGLIPRNATDVS